MLTNPEKNLTVEFVKSEIDATEKTHKQALKENRKLVKAAELLDGVCSARAVACIKAYHSVEEDYAAFCKGMRRKLRLVLAVLEEEAELLAKEKSNGDNP